MDSKMVGSNWYSYANNNPVGFVDASGKDPFANAAADLIKSFLKAMGIDIKDLPKTDRVLLALVAAAAAISSYIGAANACFNFASFAADGLAVGTVFGGNPLFAGLCGLGVACGVIGGALFLVGCLVELHNLVLELYLIWVENPTE